ncbi:DUF6766 family protein [Nonomuraea sp. NPDC052129]|uniref:DUF6766 family protein n=1 Tax=Nonomuraea sp. NPDC052129 TaxID=3154651 RepID=UPI00342F6312
MRMLLAVLSLAQVWGDDAQVRLAGDTLFLHHYQDGWRVTAVLSMVALSIYLRQRGSPESKPVGAPHSWTGAEG